MSSGESAAFDAVLSDAADAFIASLSQDHQEEVQHAIDGLLRDPQIDGRSKVELSFPYAPGTLGFASGQFWMTYGFANATVLYIYTVAWHWNSPHHPRHQTG